MRENGIEVTSSRTPIVRAAWANMLLFIIFVYVTIVYEILSDIGVALVFKIPVVVIVCIAGLYLYSRSISRIYRTKEDGLVIVGPLGSSQIDLSQVERIRIHETPSSQTVSLLIKKKAVRFPSLYFLIAVQTNQGCFADTKAKLSLLLEEYTRN